MPGMFDMWQGPLPSDVQAAQAAQRQEQMIVAPPAQKGLFGATAIGQAIAARRAAQQEEQRAGIFNDAWDSSVAELAQDGDVDLTRAEIRAYTTAYQTAAKAGNMALAREFIQKALDAQKAYDSAQLERDKVAAQTSTGSNERFRIEDTMRKELDENLGDAKTVALQLSNLQEQVMKNTPAGDVGAVFALMKLYDPRSVVRESEFATTEQAREGLMAHFAGAKVDGIESLNLPAEAKERILAFLRNTRFTDITRAQILDSGRAAAKQYLEFAGSEISDMVDLAEERQFSVEGVRSGLAETIGSVDVTPISEDVFGALARYPGQISLREALGGKYAPSRAAAAPAPAASGDVDTTGLSDDDKALLGL